MQWLVLFLVVAALFFALGWPADTLARDPSAPSGLLWGALTFVLPSVVWFIGGLIAHDRDKSSEAVFGLVFLFGAGSSVAALVLGTLTARAIRRRRRPRDVA